MDRENVCEFCGQVLLDGRECSCSDAKEKRETERQIANAKKVIKDVFVNSFGSETVVPPSDEALELMEICVEMLG